MLDHENITREYTFFTLIVSLVDFILEQYQNNELVRLVGHGSWCFLCLVCGLEILTMAVNSLDNLRAALQTAGSCNCS